MNRTLLNRIRMIRPTPDRTSWGRRTDLVEAGYRSSSGHGSRMPSQRATTRTQRPY
ncbi:MAG TPA: hypothetical protein VNS19_16710 [Acidimicrobiales bacterium]|jgi:hypothetical protein|nr:hypothetical protein [Acidimicrobiales bacterium]